MKKLIAAISLIASALALPAFAQTTINLEKLPAAQRQAVLAALADPSDSANTTTSATPAPAPKSAPSKELIDHAKEWAGLGQAVGSGVVAAARELGVAANEFAASDLGKITVAVLVWKYLGNQLLGVVVGVPLLVGGLWFGWFLVRRAMPPVSRIEYESVPIFGGLGSRRVIKRIEPADRQPLTDSQISMQAVGYITMAVSFIAGMMAIF